jgi:Ca2+-binding RTX toxin-like protein
VTENVGAGTDTVQTNVASYTLGANIESLTYIGAGNFSGTGNGLANTITGGAANDTLNGGAGNDSLIGGLGNDTFRFSASGFGADTVQAFDANPAAGQDLLDISGLGITAATFGALVSITDVGADVLIGIGIGIGAGTIRLVGVTDATTITAADFILA